MKHLIRHLCNLKFNRYKIFKSLNIKIKGLELFLSYNLSRKLKFSNFFKPLIEDSLISAILTLFFYFIFVFIILVLINFNIISQDPSQEVKKLYSTNDSIQYSDLATINHLIIQILEKTNGKYFLCFRSLLYIFRFNPNIYDKNFIDLCFFDPDTSIYDIVSNIIYTINLSQLDYSFSKLKYQNSGLSFKFNSFFGYYKISYKSAEIFLYLFIKSPESNEEFTSLSRFGIFYLQFNTIIKLMFDKNQNMSIINKIPVYFVDKMIYKVKVAQSYFYIPTDPFNSLMYFYPNYWYLPSNHNE